MAQEQFAGPDYFTEFDPEKFLRDIKIQADEAGKTGEDTQDAAKDSADTATTTEEAGDPEQRD